MTKLHAAAASASQSTPLSAVSLTICLGCRPAVMATSTATSVDTSPKTSPVSINTSAPIGTCKCWSPNVSPSSTRRSV
jgi:hypothetical protein